VDGLIGEIKRVATSWSAQNTTHTGHICLEALDVCGVGLVDADAGKLFESLTRLQVGSRRIMLAGNTITDVSISALSSYLWHSPEPLWELSISDNRITERGIEELLRCLYNHPSHPPRLPSAQSPTGGPGFALRLDLRGNQIEDVDAMISRVESQGGANSVKLLRTSGSDGPAPQPASDPNQQLPYLWVFLPRVSEQRKDSAEDRTQRKDRTDKKEKREKKERAEKEKKKDKREKRDKDPQQSEQPPVPAPPPQQSPAVPPPQGREGAASADREACSSRKAERRSRRARSSDHRRTRNGKRRRSGSRGRSSGSGSRSAACSREGGKADGAKRQREADTPLSASGSPKRRARHRRS